MNVNAGKCACSHLQFVSQYHQIIMKHLWATSFLYALDFLTYPSSEADTNMQVAQIWISITRLQAHCITRIIAPTAHSSWCQWVTSNCFATEPQGLHLLFRCCKAYKYLLSTPQGSARSSVIYTEAHLGSMNEDPLFDMNPPWVNKDNRWGYQDWGLHQGRQLHIHRRTTKNGKEVHEGNLHKQYKIHWLRVTGSSSMI